MNAKQNPFSLYDFLGYFTPGAIVLFGSLAVAWHLQGDHATTGALVDKLSFDKAEIYIPFVLAAYAIGHLLNFLSSVTVEKYAVWALGYPSKYLLGHGHPKYLDLGTPAKGRRANRAWPRQLLAIAVLPIAVLDQLLGAKAQMRDIYAAPLDSLLINVLTQKVDRLIRERGELDRPAQFGTSADTDFFRYAYHYAVEHAANHLPKMQNYVALYGFLRTLALIALLLFWVMIWHAFQGTLTYGQIAAYLLATSGLAFILFMGFAKFYRRFSLEALMAVAVTYGTDRQAN